jgi:hypothetical protein
VAEDHAISFYDLRRGTPVMSSDGVQVGTVRKAMHNVREHIFDGLVIDTKAGRRFVDAPEVGRMTQAAVGLTITAAEAVELPEHAGPLSGLEHRAQRRVNRLKRRLTGS